MEPADLLLLPVELLYQISSYLSVDDVLSCSLTCHYLRYVLNDNMVWKRYMPMQDISSLQFKEHQVQPAFDLSQTLTPLCENRVHFIRKTQLVNNWKQGKFKEYSTNSSYHYSNSMFNRTLGCGKLIYRDHYLFLSRFINDYESDAIEVWDIKASPVLYTLIEVEDVNYLSFHIIDTKLVVVECCKVDVYEIILPEKVFPLAYSFICTEENITFHRHVSHPVIHGISCTGWSHSIVDQYLISNNCNEPAVTLHVWDIVNAFKKGSFLSPIHGFSVRVRSHLKSDWLLEQTSQCPDKDGIFFFYFNIEKQEFSKSIFEYYNSCGTRDMLFHESNVIIIKNAEENTVDGSCHLVCTVYDFNTSAELKRRRFNDSGQGYTPGTAVIVNGTFVLLRFDCFLIINALSLEIVDYFRCEHNVRYITHHFNVFSSVFVVTCNNKYMLDIWDIKSKTKIPIDLKAGHMTHLHLDELYHKLVCFRNVIRVFNFW